MIKVILLLIIIITNTYINRSIMNFLVLNVINTLLCKFNNNNNNNNNINNYRNNINAFPTNNYGHQMNEK